MPARPPHPDLKSYAAIFIAQTLVGGSVVASKFISLYFPLFLANSLRLLLSLALLLPWLLIKGGLPRLNRGQFRLLFWQSFLGLFAFNIFLLWGLKYTTASAAGIITSLTPAAVAILARFFLGERVGPGQGLGLGLALAGLLALNAPSLALVLSGGRAGELFGNFLIVLVVLCEAAFVVLGKASRLAPGPALDPMASTVILALVSTALFLPFSLNELASFHVSLVPFSGWAGLGYYAVMVSVGATVLWFYGMARVSASAAGIFSSLIGLTAVAASHFLLGESLQTSQVLGGLFILAALALVTAGGKQGA